MSNSSRTDWEALERMRDDEIDYSDIPPLGKESFGSAELRISAAEAERMVKLDPDVLAWFQSKGSDYRSLINSVLREHIAGG
jgi:uncharacterized protein (DUF4415 family)